VSHFGKPRTFPSLRLGSNTVCWPHGALLQTRHLGALFSRPSPSCAMFEKTERHRRSHEGTSLRMIPTRSRSGFLSPSRSRQPITRWLDVKPLSPEFRGDMRDSRFAASADLESLPLSQEERVSEPTETPPQGAERPFRRTPLSRRITRYAAHILSVFPMLVPEAAFLRPLMAALIPGFQSRLQGQLRKQSVGTRRAE